MILRWQMIIFMTKRLHKNTNIQWPLRLLDGFDYIWGSLVLLDIKLRVTFYMLLRPAFVDEVGSVRASSIQS